MGRRQWPLILLLLFFRAASPAELEPAPPQTGTLLITEYIAELDGLASTAKQLARPEEVPRLLNEIPHLWRIQTAQRTFEMSSEWLRQSLNDWQKKPSSEIQNRVLTPPQ